METGSAMGVMNSDYYSKMAGPMPQARCQGLRGVHFPDSQILKSSIGYYGISINSPMM
jgi:hypothetical protein